VPYHLPALLQAKYIWIVEGEKDVDNLRKINLTATCNPFGAGKWTAELNQYFRTHQHITIIPDNDDPGRKHAQQVAANLYGKVASIKMLELSGLPEKGDVSDWLVGRDPETAAEELSRLADAAPEWKPKLPETDKVETFEAPPWEKPAPAADAKIDLLPYLLNDHGNSQRVIAFCGDDLRYCHPLRKFLVWEGRRWRADTTKQAYKLAKMAMLEYLQQAIRAGSEAHEKFARQSLEAKRINSMLEMMQSELFAEPEELDRDPYLLNFTNGVVDLHTGELRPHDRYYMITKIINHAFSPGAKCANFLAFLYRVMGIECDRQRSEQLVKYLQKAIGYSLTGVTNEKLCFILWGSGNNGKTTFLALMRRILGEYAGLLQIETLMARREESNNAQSDLADLRGLRFVMTSETEEGQRLAEGKLKRITQGMGTIKAARKYENGIEFLETHKLWLDANHRPVVRGTDNAIWNRLHLIPFTVEIPRAEQDPDLSNKLMSEAEGILAWAVQGAVAWYRDRLDKPPDVEKASEEWRAESDALKNFVEECCILDSNVSCRSSDLWKAYAKWADENGEKQLLTRFKLAERLQMMGCKSDRTTQARSWRGIGLLV
jgi:putative DNA primase/helicase